MRRKLNCLVGTSSAVALLDRRGYRLHSQSLHMTGCGDPCRKLSVLGFSVFVLVFEKSCIHGPNLARRTTQDCEDLNLFSPLSGRASCPNASLNSALSPTTRKGTVYSVVRTLHGTAFITCWAGPWLDSGEKQSPLFQGRLSHSG